MTTYESAMAGLGRALQRSAERRAARRKTLQHSRRHLGSGLQFVGLGVLDFAAYTWAPIAGYVAIGASLLLAGWMVGDGGAGERQ